jgi:RimJ/RimL family protein N-acetyltransferase
MTPYPVLHTPRLRLEPLNLGHLDGLLAVNGDAEVMRYISGHAETREDALAMIERVQARWAEHGFSWWAFIDNTHGEFIGTGCVQHLGRDAANPLELGWRLRRDRWGQGYASEAARRMAAFAFDDLAAPLLCAVCDPANTASSQVMQRLGMHYTGQERWYDSECSVYRISREDWQIQAYAKPARPA